jgi:hypothetical protein
MKTRPHHEHHNIPRLSQVATRGIIPLFVTVLVLVTSCSTTQPNPVADTAPTAPVAAPSSSTSSSTTTSSTLAPTTVTPIVTAPEVDARGAGFTSLFVGHSFFDPIATKFEEHAARAGFLQHSQVRVMVGGGGGAPEALWNDPERRSEIQAHLSRGDINLFGMTYHPDFPTLTGYRLWVEEALSHNPQTAFFVGMPWVREPASMTAAAYTLTTGRAYETLMSPIIDQLKEEFPGSTFFAIPYGHAASELYELFESGQLPGIRAVIGDHPTSLFIDSLGHTSYTVVEELAVLVWLRAIYCVDLSEYSYPSNFSADLTTIAMDIVANQRADDAAPWCRAAQL